ncbi:peptidoglycan D,D-transpeptidase FtsI family protein [Oscillatoria salina]|uniref:peptidoglycan D,D-transpeptidase FtsI family protein n=1 Tax=Oscillatoria salina TaxID=331517 RepID=UPI0013B639CC|nr:penicillin-binding protein 2 [Oscillatoria salina]MBZ8182395.1 penicillin-binding protein 2 [Oscillatoria salina IIICB1]NET87511.1 penicillin-binding protein 2 [Kamptonema sp. SIO1D9]
MTKVKRRVKKNSTQTAIPKEKNGGGKVVALSDRIPVSLPKKRLLLVWGIILAAGLGLGLNLYRLQIVRAPVLEEKARQQQMVYMRPYIPRRPIIDRQGTILATDRLVYSLYAHPKLFKISREEMAVKLAGILPNKTTEELVSKFNQSESGIRLVYSLPEEIADKISALSLDGIELLRQYSRLYPQQELASEVVGYVDMDHRGQAGVEYSQQKLLERAVLTLQLNRAGNGALMPAHLPEGFLNYDELQLQLTLDLRLQRVANLALKQKLAEFDAKRGSVIVMDVRDGSILALVCEPSYNPNQYYNYDVGLFRNWTITDVYEPGSTFKPINVAIALDAGAIQPNSVFYDQGLIKIDTWEIANYDYYTRGAYGNINVTQILETSNNVGMVQIIKQMKAATFYGALERLGIEERMGIDLPGEAGGQLKDRNQFLASEVEAATTSFGQGFSLTPLKLAQLQAAIANGGKLVTPHVIRGLVDPQGNYQYKPRLQTKPVFSPETSQTVLQMMESVVANGTGKTAAIPGYRIAGKTGTAQKASPSGGYSETAKITSFVGILPVESPRYVVVAVVDEPKRDNAFGSTVAAPIVKSVMESLIAIEGIPPAGFQ